MASILTATSTPMRTSPVLRGKRILETLLGETRRLTLVNYQTIPGQWKE